VGETAARRAKRPNVGDIADMRSFGHAWAHAGQPPRSGRPAQACAGI